ncbi:hypothetical protein BCR42DRAFT_236940 [Absidia repens]|uniref:Cyclin-domain-containing protein n=1 Tax=Absidia repens TaxID=90262 RepID=A0A1X2H755_9FUNG|nr:hypothetical protein BCR42DRAFT_236940 [Absidia repens]
MNLLMYAHLSCAPSIVSGLRQQYLTDFLLTKRTVDTGTFVKTILRLSRTRHSTLLIAIFYLFRIKPRLQKSISTSSLEDRRYLVCGRRMFLVALLLACKFQNDVTPKNNVWARASGLPVAQINYTERLFLGLLDYQLYISKESMNNGRHWWSITVKATKPVFPDHLMFILETTTMVSQPKVRSPPYYDYSSSFAFSQPRKSTICYAY